MFQTECHQAPLFWRQVYAPDRHVQFEEPFEDVSRERNLYVLQRQPLDYGSRPPSDHVPLYWPLPEIFLGDRSGSYNGFIRFRIRNDDNYRRKANIPPDRHKFRWNFFIVAMRICLSRFLIFFHTSTVITKPPKYLAPKIWRRKNVLNIANIFTPIFFAQFCVLCVK